MAIQDDVVQAAEKWLGYLEKQSEAQLVSLTANAGSRNYTIFAAQYKALWDEDFQAQSWCAVFVSVMLRQGCGREIVPHFASCAVGIRNFKAGRGGTWQAKSPVRGDLVFFADDAGKPAHVGLVSSVSADTLVTIEGNTSGASGVVPNGGGVWRKAYALPHARILGYGRPAYDAPPQGKNRDRQTAQARFGFDADTMAYLDRHPYPDALYQKLAEK